MIEALEGAPAVQIAREALEGHDAWLVGGVVRDALMGRPIADVDLAVSGEPEDVARRLSAALRGPAFSLSEEFGSWRVLSRDRAASYDISALRGQDIETDLAHRDFTVNAIAVPLAGGEPIDPSGGRADLDAGVLRVLGAGAYEDDPLRPLRLVRLAAELGLWPDQETERLTTAAAPRLAEPAPERVFAELKRLVTAPGVLPGLALAERTAVLGAVLPELTSLEGLEQSRFHHLDVYRHTLEVLERLLQLEGDLEEVFGEQAAGVRAVLDEPLADDLTRGQALRFGALLHDIAKPQTAGRRPDGKPTFIGHDREGVELSRQILTRLRASEKLRAFVGALTLHHLALGFLVHERPLDAHALYRYFRRTDPVEVEVTVLSCADRMATRGEGQEPWIAAHLDLAGETMGAALAWRAEGPPRPPLAGDVLAAELGREPGPWLGEALAELEEAVYTGEVETREQAIAFARGHQPGDPPESPA